MKLITHYLRQVSLSRLGCELECLVYQAIPDDRLCTFDDIFSRLGHVCHQQGVDNVPSRKTTENVVKTLMDNGFLKEFTGPRLLRLLL